MTQPNNGRPELIAPIIVLSVIRSGIHRHAIGQTRARSLAWRMD